MPELPEVETIRRQLEPLLVGADIVDAWAFPSAKFDQAPLAVGHTITEVARRGKYLLMTLVPTGLMTPAPTGLTTPAPTGLMTPAPTGPDPGARDGRRQLVVHLGMTGRLAVLHDDAELGEGSTFSHLRARWDLDDGRVLVFDDVRRFGRLAVVGFGQHDELPTLAALGPEPFDDAFTPQHLRSEVNSRRRAVKTLLLSQRVVAGVGNIYADEALWRAGVHPGARRLTVAQSERLRDTVRDVLQTGVDNGGTTLRNYRDAEGGSGTNQRHLDCYGRYGEPCARCGETLRRSVIDARTTSFCPSCQRK